MLSFLLRWTGRAIAAVVAGFVLLFLLILMACQPVYATDVTPSPDRRASVLVKSQLGGATTSGPNEIFLVGAPDEQVSLGVLEREGPLVGWTDDTTINVCHLEPVAGAKHRAVIKDAAGTRRLFRVTSDCPPGPGRGSATGPPRGYDYGDAAPVAP
jgi:hypothetical protein